MGKNENPPSKSPLRLFDKLLPGRPLRKLGRVEYRLEYHTVMRSRAHKLIIGLFIVVLAACAAYSFVMLAHRDDAVPTGKAANNAEVHANKPAANGAKLPLQHDDLSSSDLTEPRKKEIAMELVSSAENSTLNWKAQYGYVEDIGDGRGYTGGLIGFTSATGDMLSVVRRYDQLRPGNALSRYIPALEAVTGTDSHEGLDPGFVSAWKAAASDTAFQAAQDEELDTNYFNPAVSQAKADGLHALGQFIYYDALVMHGPGSDALSFGGIRSTALAHARTPAQGGNEATYLSAFLDARKAAMLADPSHQRTDRVDTEQRVFLQSGNLNLNPPLTWSTYGDTYSIP